MRYEIAGVKSNTSMFLFSIMKESFYIVKGKKEFDEIIGLFDMKKSGGMSIHF